MKNRVRELRKKYNMTQQQLADAVYVSARTIISLEQGQYNPSIMLAYRITILFATTIEDLYCLKKIKTRRINIMMIKNHRNLMNAILGFVLLIACIYVMVINGLQVKYIIGLVISVGLIVVNLIWGQREKGAKEVIMGQADERDLYNAMKISRAVLKITNDICFISAVSLFVIYAITKTDIYLNIRATLVVVIIVMFIAFLLCDHYYETHN